MVYYHVDDVSPENCEDRSVNVHSVNLLLASLSGLLFRSFVSNPVGISCYHNSSCYFRWHAFRAIIFVVPGNACFCSSFFFSLCGTRGWKIITCVGFQSMPCGQLNTIVAQVWCFGPYSHVQKRLADGVTWEMFAIILAGWYCHLWWQWNRLTWIFLAIWGIGCGLRRCNSCTSDDRSSSMQENYKYLVVNSQFLPRKLD